MKPLLLLPCLALLAALVGCSSDDAVDEFCDRVAAAGCAFENGTCRSNMAESLELAQDRGCEPELDDVLQCWADALETSCTTDIELGCGAQKDALNACDPVN